MTIEEIGRISVFNDTQANVEALTGIKGEMRFARRSTDNALGFSLDGSTWYWISAGHDAVTVADTGTVDLTLSGQEISADVIPGGIDAADLVSGAADDGDVLTADGSGGAAWEAPAASSGDVATDTIWDAKGDLAVGTGANTAAKLSVGTDGKYLKAASGEATGLIWDTPASGGDCVLISDTVLGDNGSFDIQNISQDYKDLLVIFDGHCTNDVARFVFLAFNNDTTWGNYRSVQVSTNGTTYTTQAQSYPIIVDCVKSSLNPVISSCKVLIPNYSGSTHQKTAICEGLFATSTTNILADNWGMRWLNANAISRITVTAEGGNDTFAAGSRLTIYGLG